MIIEILFRKKLHLPVYIQNITHHKTFEPHRTSFSDNLKILKIACIGESTTYGAGPLSYKETYPYILEQLFLKNNIKNVEVINLGLSGHNSIDQYNKAFLNILSSQPHIIIYMSGWNDIWKSIKYEPKYFNILHKGVTYFIGKSYIFRFIFLNAIKRTSYVSDLNYNMTLAQKKIIEQYNGVLNQIINKSEKYEIDLIFLDRPKYFEKRDLKVYLHKNLTWKYINTLDHYLNLEIRNISKMNPQITYISLKDIFDLKDNKEELFKDDGFHFTSRGNNIIVLEIFNKINSR